MTEEERVSYYHDLLVSDPKDYKTQLRWKKRLDEFW